MWSAPRCHRADVIIYRSSQTAAQVLRTPNPCAGDGRSLPSLATVAPGIQTRLHGRVSAADVHILSYLCRRTVEYRRIKARRSGVARDVVADCRAVGLTRSGRRLKTGAGSPLHHGWRIRPGDPGRTGSHWCSGATIVRRTRPAVPPRKERRRQGQDS
jgi:hypothetical protein